MIQTFPKESFSKLGRKPPGLKTRATTIANAIAVCCSPPLQRRGLSAKVGDKF